MKHSVRKTASRLRPRADVPARLETCPVCWKRTKKSVFPAGYDMRQIGVFSCTAKKMYTQSHIITLYLIDILPTLHSRYFEKELVLLRWLSFIVPLHVQYVKYNRCNCKVHSAVLRGAWRTEIKTDNSSEVSMLPVFVYEAAFSLQMQLLFDVIESGPSEDHNNYGVLFAFIAQVRVGTGAHVPGYLQY